MYSLKKKFQELEGTTVYKGPSVEPTYEEVRVAKAAEVRVAEKPEPVAEQAEAQWKKQLQKNLVATQCNKTINHYIYLATVIQ